MSDVEARPNVTLDVSPVEVRGAVRGSKARVIYADGKLYVALNVNDVRVLEMEQPTETKASTQRRPWSGQWEGQGISFYRRGCATCGYTLNRHAAATLIAKAKTVGE